MVVSKSVDELRLLFEMGHIKYNTPIHFRFPNGEKADTTYGRLLIWELSGLLINEPLDKKGVQRLVIHINENYPPEIALKKMKKLQDLAFKVATEGSVSLSMDDFKFDLEIDLGNIQRELDKQPDLDERQRLRIIDDTINKEVQRWIDTVDRDNPLYHMYKSGARVTPTQIRQMLIAKGLLTNMTGEIGKYAIPTSLASGLSPLDYFRTAGPARRGLANNFFVVPASGYFARQLVNAARDLPVVEFDCGTQEGIDIPAKLAHGRVIAARDEVFDLNEWEGSPDDVIKVRSPITCPSIHGGICAMCAGTDPSTGELWRVGIGLGTIAAQHISEPSTQLGLRGKHTSGSITLKDYDTSVDNVLGDIMHSFGGVGTMYVSTAHSTSETLFTMMQKHKGDVIKAAAELSVYINKLFSDMDVQVYSTHIETILRGCTDQVKMNDGKIGLRSFGCTGKIIPLKVSQVPTQHPSWLKSIAHGYVKQRLIRAVVNSEVSYGVYTERIITTKLTDK